MSDQLKDGGPAFPWQEWINSSDPFVKNPIEHKGMTLRDWFAGQAMKALVEMGHSDNKKKMAAHAYSLADAMIEGRKEGWL